ncbi:MAG: undecaprenyl/decaprenyl-phosphate alpha-N-acetylglucosaminyl 1-phosphate transferase [Flavobacteriales bacterium]|nr:undecaprenyl/decaprenyl-phosphate alpha-N-acetylglucosaminyl 1-phosphate transferase [Flavobacteriales bacterium]
MPSLIKVAHLKNLTDEPDDKRKLHKKKIPTIGGILIFAGTLFSYFIWFHFRTEAEDFGALVSGVRDFQFIGATMLLLFFVGVKDDIIGTAATKKLAAHLIVSFILVLMADIRITGMKGIFGIYELPYWASVFLSVFTYTVIVNAFNLIDGVDGLAAGIGSIATIAMGIWFYFAGGIELSVLAFAMAGSLIGFLIFNFSPAKIFMGDSGSLTIGLIISVLSIRLIEFPVSDLPDNMLNISKPVFVLACLSYPLIDTLRVFIYRTLKGASPFTADRNHIHHRLLKIGLSDRQCVLIIYFFNLLIMYLAITFDFLDPSYTFVLLIGFTILLSQIPFFVKQKVDASGNFRVIKKEDSEGNSPESKVS